VITRKVARVSSWLRTPSIGEYLALYDTAVVVFPGAGGVRVMRSTEFHMAIGQIIAFHLVPPADEGIDYDARESNRRMQAVTAIAGPVRIDASIRVPVVATMLKFFESLREPYTMLYDATVSCAEGSVPPVQVSAVMVKASVFSFAIDVS